MKILVFGGNVAHGCWDKGGGWVFRLRELSSSRNGPRVINLASPGDNCRTILEKMEEESRKNIAGSDAVMMVSVGLDDSVEVDGKAMVPPEEFNDRVNKLIEVSGKFSPHVLFLGPTPVDEEKTNPLPWDKKKSYSNERIENYASIMKAVCKDRHVPFIDVFSGFPPESLEKGLYPGESGHKFILDRVKTELFKRKLI